MGTAVDSAELRQFDSIITNDLRDKSTTIEYLEWISHFLVALGAAAMGALAVDFEWDRLTGTYLVLSILAVLGGLYCFWKKTSLRKILTRAALYSPRDAANHIAELEERCEGLQSIQDGHVRWAKTLRGFVAAAREYASSTNDRVATKKLGNHTTIANEVNSDFYLFLDTCMRELEENRFRLFGIESEGEVYFFDVFEIRRSDEKLYLAGRRKSSQADEHKRSWRVGQGTVGECVYRQRGVLFNYDVTPHEDFDPHPEATDSQYFGCRISVPILAGDNRAHHCYGAMCITSEKSSRLDYTHLALCETIAFILATFFYVRESAVQRLSTKIEKLERPGTAPVLP